MIAIDIRGNITPALRALDGLHPQFRFATALGLTKTAQAAKKDLQVAMPKVFDAPTRWTLNSIYVRPAKKTDLQARVWFKDTNESSAGAYLEPEVFGGPRKLKRFEASLRRIGILQPGYFVVPGKGLQLDANGNIPRSLIIRLLSYFQAFGEQGYRANSTAAGRAKLAKRGKLHGYSTIRGVEYFATQGNLRSGKGSHLPPGIWSRSGIHGSDIKPVLIFVRQPMYLPRFDAETIVREAVARELPIQMDAAWDQAVRTGRSK